MSTPTDEQLIERCRSGDPAAFEELVKRYQVLVCSIAYCIVGDFTASEDIGQDVFLQAWRKLSDLRDAGEFKSWLTTIARNQARGWLRSRANQMHELGNTFLEQRDEVPTVDQEEAELVWSTLARLPESYREPLVLFYRQDKSVAEVAESLELSEAATKQRLSRGREMLRNEVLAAVERSLRKSAPAAPFTVAVMAIITGTSKTAAAATGAISTPIAAAAAKSAVGGAVAGSFIGLLGGFLGGFAGWYNAEYASQRRFIVRQALYYGIGLFVFSIPFIAMVCGWRPVETLGVDGYKKAHAIWMLTFFALNFLWMGWGFRHEKRLREQAVAGNDERLPRYRKLQEAGTTIVGRRWTSNQSWLGLPLCQIAFPDYQVGADREQVKQQGTARAWIAIGHCAYGRLLAVGHRAIGPIAVGTQAVGIISLGVFAVGVFAGGVMCLAPLAAGVITVGVISVSGSMAAGMYAVAPLAFGVRAAKGAMVLSAQYAEGPSAFAPHANDAAATAFIQSSAIMQRLDSLLQMLVQATRGTSLTPWVVAFVCVAVLLQRLVVQPAHGRTSD
ncbi:MAG: sigma-70 family RNA polymerase sigma factor [Planctomycetales bacterium]|nr:sigma-70 family RNA polymerase sigma factor [Planctomycetales bacterium]